MTNEDYNHAYIFALGYYDARVEGVMDDGIESEDRFWYKAGYDKGIADYCELQESNNE